MFRFIYQASRAMILSPVALLLAVLFLPVFIVSDNIPLFQNFLDFMYKHESA